MSEHNQVGHWKCETCQAWFNYEEQNPHQKLRACLFYVKPPVPKEDRLSGTVNYCRQCC